MAALLAIARRSQHEGRYGEEPQARDADDGWLEVGGGGGDGDLDELVLWVEIRKQIETLREGMESEKNTAACGRNRSRKK